MNFIKVKTTGVNGNSVSVETDDLKPVAVTVDPSGAKAGDELTLGIRPEHIHLGKDSGIAVTVAFVERLGHETIVQAERANDGGRLIAVLEGDIEVKSGEKVHFSFSDADCHLFNADGNALMRSALAS
jgi:multiple sugar transport system ATP-binding protein